MTKTIEYRVTTQNAGVVHTFQRVQAKTINAGIVVAAAVAGRERRV